MYYKTQVIEELNATAFMQSDNNNNVTHPPNTAKTQSYTSWQSILILFFCFLIITGTVVGNALVCTAVALVRKLRTPSNLLIVSLAVSDLMVALLVMSFAAMYEVLIRLRSHLNLISIYIFFLNDGMYVYFWHIDCHR